MKPSSRAVHAGRHLEARSPLAPDLSPASVHVFTDLDDYDAVVRGERPGHYYGRNSNSTADQPGEAEDQVQRLRSTELHALHPVVKSRSLEAQEIDRSCDFQDVLLDVTLYHFAEDFLTFPLCRIDE